MAGSDAIIGVQESAKQHGHMGDGKLVVAVD